MLDDLGLRDVLDSLLTVDPVIRVILPCTSKSSPLMAKPSPRVPCPDKWWPLMMILQMTDIIFRVVVMVEQTSGSKLATIKKTNDCPTAEHMQAINTM